MAGGAPESGSSALPSAAPNMIGGYIDNPIPMTTFRLRYDAGFNVNRPDRAEFFYAEWAELAFHPHGINGDGVYLDPKARGPAALPQTLNYQEASTYLEYAFNRRFSVFLDVPYRYDHFGQDQEEAAEAAGQDRTPTGGFFPEPNRGATDAGGQPFNTSGFSDLQAGFKFALLANPGQYLTFQLRTYTPTGNSHQGLGTGHVSLEPGLLLSQRLTDRMVLLGQFRDWIPIEGARNVIDGRPFAGNILIYGLGLSYDAYRRQNLRISPIGEVVGWTVLDGLESFFGTVTATAPPGVALPVTHGVEDAGGATIVNLKFGVRTYLWDRHSVYVGYGRCVTGSRWYQDIFSVEYRLIF